MSTLAKCLLLIIVAALPVVLMLAFPSPEGAVVIDSGASTSDVIKYDFADRRPIAAVLNFLANELVDVFLSIGQLIHHRHGESLCMTLRKDS